MSRPIEIRQATAEDASTIVALVQALAHYERAADQAKATEADFLRDGFGEGRRFFEAIVARDSGADVGLAFYFFTYSTWTGRPTLYLEDLFVVPEARRRGVGSALLKTLARIAVDAGCGRMDWSVLDWNTDAQDFYQSLGAAVLGEWRSVRLEGEALERLAGNPPLQP